MEPNNKRMRVEEQPTNNDNDDDVWLEEQMSQMVVPLAAQPTVNAPPRHLYNPIEQSFGVPRPDARFPTERLLSHTPPADRHGHVPAQTSTSTNQQQLLQSQQRHVHGANAHKTPQGNVDVQQQSNEQHDTELRTKQAEIDVLRRNVLNRTREKETVEKQLFQLKEDLQRERQQHQQSVFELKKQYDDALSFTRQERRSDAQRAAAAANQNLNASVAAVGADATVIPASQPVHQDATFANATASNTIKGNTTLRNRHQSNSSEFMTKRDFYEKPRARNADGNTPIRVDNYSHPLTAVSFATSSQQQAQQQQQTNEPPTISAEIRSHASAIVRPATTDVSLQVDVADEERATLDQSYTNVNVIDAAASCGLRRVNLLTDLHVTAEHVHSTGLILGPRPNIPRVNVMEMLRDKQQRESFNDDDSIQECLGADVDENHMEF